MINTSMRVVLILLGVAALGCGRDPSLIGPERLNRGMVIVLPGIEGVSPFNRAIVAGLDRGGVKWAIDLHDWTTGVPGNYLYHQRAEGRNRQQAAAIAERIRQYKVIRPRAPVVLVGQSGGGAIATWVAEAMPEGTKVDGLILLSPTLSPQYGMSKALGNTRRGVVNFYSPRDWVFLGIGTTVTGTMDGQHGNSAGRAGFKAFPAPDAQPGYEKLFQISWNREMARVGHGGGHLTGAAEDFVASYVAPLVLREQWNEKFVIDLLTREDYTPGGLLRPVGSSPPPASRPASHPAPTVPRTRTTTEPSPPPAWRPIVPAPPPASGPGG